MTKVQEIKRNGSRERFWVIRNDANLAIGFIRKFKEDRHTSTPHQGFVYTSEAGEYELVETSYAKGRKGFDACLVAIDEGRKVARDV